MPITITVTVHRDQNTIDPPRALASGVARVPTVTGVTGASVSAVRATATGVARVPGVVTGFKTYTTNFPLMETPLSEGGKWVDGGTLGLDWANCSTTPGKVIGLQAGASFTDATAILTGVWAPNQQVTATVFSTNPTPQENCYEEVEVRMRSALSAHSNTGYEITWKVSPTDYAYMIIVRWNGPVGNYTILFQSPNLIPWGVGNGDIVSGKIVGNTITAYKNGVVKATVTDNTYTTGNPGIGFNLENAASGCSGTNGSYGFTTVTAAEI